MRHRQLSGGFPIANSERAEMTVPTIHLNGTSKAQLVESLCNASVALRAAYTALKETAPNGRDYYPQGPAAMDAAQEEHFDRLRRVDAVRKEIDQLTIAIDQQG
jgi:hypothetical protein